MSLAFADLNRRFEALDEQTKALRRPKIERYLTEHFIGMIKVLKEDKLKCVREPLDVF